MNNTVQSDGYKKSIWINFLPPDLSLAFYNLYCGSVLSHFSEALQRYGWALSQMADQNQTHGALFQFDPNILIGTVEPGTDWKCQGGSEMGCIIL